MHKVVNVVTTGSVGDLGRIARALADADINIAAIGGGEGGALGGTVGIVTMLVTPDADSERIEDTLRDLPLDGNRTLTDVTIYPGLDVELGDTPGQLAEAAGLLGEDGINIMGVLTVDVHLDWAHVSLAFEDDGIRDRARDVLIGGGFRVLPEHGAQDRRRQIDRILRGIRKGDEI